MRKYFLILNQAFYTSFFVFVWQIVTNLIYAKQIISRKKILIKDVITQKSICICF